MRKILHVGTHKTATTSFQAALNENTDSLLRQGLIYPNLKGTGLPEGYGHHPLLGALAQNPTEGQRAVKRMMRKCEEGAEQATTLLISSERCYRHTLFKDDTETLIEGRTNFVRLLAETFGGDTEVVIVLRRPDSFIESNYQETIKKTNSTDRIARYYGRPAYQLRLDYAFQIRLFQKFFQKIHVLIYEDLIKDPEGPSIALLKELDLNVTLDIPPPRKNSGLHTYLVEYKRLMNYQKLPKAQRRALMKSLLKLHGEKKFSWQERKIAFLGLESRQQILEDGAEGLDWIAKTFFKTDRKSLFPEIVQDIPVLFELPIAVFEEIQKEVFR